MIHLYNTLTHKKEEFHPLEEGVVKLYVCGPTVYSDAHVGHAMSALVFDIIRRYLEFRGLKVQHVMNFTDVDDKIIIRANKLGVDPFELAEGYIQDFREHLDDLNILPATSNPRATQTMDKILDMIKGLVEKGFAYPASNGDVYFRVTRDEDYGKLSGRRLEDMQAGSRIDVEELKEHPMDFALWKAAKPGEPAWESPWGLGRPGWHIECSAMNLHELGEQIDIHGGGNDLIFPHHENEIAQSEGFTGKKFAQIWIHNGMLQLGGEKMSKSIGNCRKYSCSKNALSYRLPPSCAMSAARSDTRPGNPSGSCRYCSRTHAGSSMLAARSSSGGTIGKKPEIVYDRPSPRRLEGLTTNESGSESPFTLITPMWTRSLRSSREAVNPTNSSPSFCWTTVVKISSRASLSPPSSSGTGITSKPDEGTSISKD